MILDKFRIPVSMLSPTVEPAQLGFDDTGELEPLNEIIGQEPAVEAKGARRTHHHRSVGEVFHAYVRL